MLSFALACGPVDLLRGVMKHKRRMFVQFLPCLAMMASSLGGASCEKVHIKPSQSAPVAKNQTGDETAPADPLASLSVEEEKLYDMMIDYFVAANRPFLSFNGDCDQLATAMATAEPAKWALWAQGDAMVKAGYGSDVAAAIDALEAKISKTAADKDFQRRIGVTFADAGAAEKKARERCGSTAAFKAAMKRIGVFKKKAN